MIEITNRYSKEININVGNYTDLIDIIRHTKNTKLNIDTKAYINLLKYTEIREKLPFIKLYPIRDFINYYKILKYFSLNQLETFLEINNINDFNFEYNRNSKHDKEIYTKDFLSTNKDKIKLIRSHLKSDCETKIYFDLLMGEIENIKISTLEPKKKFIKADENTNVLFNNIIFDDVAILIEFIYENKLENIIKNHNLTEHLKKHDKLFTLIDQKYFGSHNIEDKVLALMANNKYKIWDLESIIDGFHDYIDIKYIIENIKYYNLRNLLTIQNVFFRIRWNWPDNESITEKNNEIFKLLSIKFAKYMLSNHEYTKFIKEYQDKSNKMKEK